MPRRTAFAFVLLSILSGCTHHYVADPTTFPLDAVPRFSSTDAVALIDGQSSSADVLFATNMGHEWYGNLQAWTETAIAIAQTELEKRGMSVSQKAPRSLKMSVISANTTSGGWGFRCITNLQVETGAGYVRTYVGEGPSPILTRAADAAVMKAVAAMFKDENIISYLTN
jgi:hypothetical protein